MDKKDGLKEGETDILIYKEAWGFVNQIVRQNTGKAR